MMELYNLMEKEVLNAVEKIYGDMDNGCKCEKCKLDIAAIALNTLNPKYVVTEKGYLLTKVNNMNYQFQSDIITAVIKAIEIVVENPKHSL